MRPAGMMDLAILADPTDETDEGFIPVPETPATTARPAPMFPPGRYGRRRDPRRRDRSLYAAGLTVVVLLGALIAIVGYQRYGDPAYQAEVVTYTDITEDQVVITFRVHLPDGKGAVCGVRARSRDGAVVGRAEVPVPAGRGQMTYRLVTNGRPFIGEVVRCRAA